MDAATKAKLKELIASYVVAFSAASDMGAGDLKSWKMDKEECRRRTAELDKFIEEL